MFKYLSLVALILTSACAVEAEPEAPAELQCNVIAQSEECGSTACFDCNRAPSQADPGFIRSECEPVGPTGVHGAGLYFCLVVF
jgi:hypothetical protein